MWRYLARRTIQLIPLFLIVTMLTFGLMYLSPGGPETIFLAREDKLRNPEEIAKLRDKWGLNDPFPVQYAKWVGNMLRGDLGRSFTSGRPVMEGFRQRLPASLQLGLVSLLLTYLLAIPLGVISAVRQYSWMDYVASTFSFLFYSMPVFWVGIMLIAWVALPSGGAIPTNGYANPNITLESSGLVPLIFDRLRYMLLPVITLTLTSMAALTRYMRNSMLEVLREDYIRTARAKGVAEKVVIYKHALRNAILPIVTLSGSFVAGSLFGGAVLTERVFAWPGVGWLSLKAVNQQDRPVVMAFLVFGFFVAAAFGFLTDIVYVWVDPRIKYS